MIQIKPKIDISTQCKVCQSGAVNIQFFFFQGIHTLADSICQNCGFKFYWTLPIGHDLLFPIHLSKDNKKAFFHPRAKDWLAAPLIRSMKAGEGSKVEISIKTNRQLRDIVIVNCLDNCFGHVLTKIWNAYTLIDSHPQLGIIVLIPENLQWLLPPDIAETWAVHLPLKALDNKLTGLDEFVHKQLERFERIHLSQTYTHLDHTRYIDMEKVLKRSRFDLATFERQPPCITFVLREDRFWYNRKSFDLLMRLSVKVGLKEKTKALFVSRQNQLVKKTAEAIKKALPEATFYATGLGKTDILWEEIEDLRVEKIQSKTETLWNATYAESHLVIGVHGSSMLIPTALAAGFINILPRHKLEHLGEDTLLPYSNRFLHFLGRYLDEYATSQLVALHAISMIRHFPYQYRNTVHVPE